jgi:A/G-specific adenine glycosylase
LWGFPLYVRQGRTGFAETLRVGAAGEFGLELAVGRKTGRVRHAYSHFRTTLHVFECQVVGGQVQGKGRSAVKWVFPSQFLRYPFSGADRKVIQLFESLEG